MEKPTLIGSLWRVLGLPLDLPSLLLDKVRALAQRELRIESAYIFEAWEARNDRFLIHLRIVAATIRIGNGNKSLLGAVFE